MPDQRSFIDRLLRRKEKTVLTKDENGVVTGKSIINYDSFGEIIKQTDMIFNPDKEEFQLAKEKTYTRRGKDSYDPEMTYYYDEEGRVINQKSYSRNQKGVLEGEQTRFAYPNGEKKEVLFQKKLYLGGGWLTEFKEESELDEHGEVIHKKTSKYSEQLGRIVCTKDKSYTRNNEGKYDPEKTIYRDLQDRVITEKIYRRKPTELGRDVLFGTETTYNYSSGEIPEKTERKLYLREDGRTRLNIWGTMEEFQKEIEAKKLADFKAEPIYSDDGILRPEKLALVHITKYMPRKKGGEFEIQSLAQATDFLYPRNEVHFTIGHHVTSHSNGNWDNKGIMIVAPLKGTMDLNGKPLGMSSVDTYFETTPDQALKLPKGTHVFLPAETDQSLNGKLSKTDGDLTWYKTKGFTNREKLELFEKMCEFRSDHTYYNRELNRYELSYFDEENKPIIITKETVQQLSDDFCALQSKKLLLEEHLEKNGYLTDSQEKFSSHESHLGSKGIEELGEKLGCRFTSNGNQMDYWNSFFTTNNRMGELCNLIHMSNFILHTDEYQIIATKKHDTYTAYTFAKAGRAETTVTVTSSKGFEIDKTIGNLKSNFDPKELSKELSDMQKEHTAEGEGSKKWSEPFEKTFEVWSKKTVERLTELYGAAKGFNFDKWQEKLTERLKTADTREEQNTESPLPQALIKNAQTSR